MLTDITINGQVVKALAQPTKQAFLYVLNRQTGQPIWPIPEKPVEKGDVPGEWYSPTQPIPSKPPAYDLQGGQVDDLINFTPELHAQAVELSKKFKTGPVFTPPVVSKAEGPYGTFGMATAGGGTNWPGGSYDPETHIAYIPSQRVMSSIGLIPGDPKRTEFAWMSGSAAPRGTTLTVQGLPLAKPPYGSITAVDMNKGEILWQVAHGETLDNVRNSPALKGLNIPRTGRPGSFGILVTKTMIVAGEKGEFTLPDGRRGAMLRAYDKASGKEIGNGLYMPAPQTGTPMTYTLNGRQFIVLAIGSGTYGAEFVAFALPSGQPVRQGPPQAE
jgi:quinoprotein glucose dehydrogenase